MQVPVQVSPFFFSQNPPEGPEEKEQVPFPPSHSHDQVPFMPAPFLRAYAGCTNDSEAPANSRATNMARCIVTSLRYTDKQMYHVRSVCLSPTNMPCAATRKLENNLLSGSCRVKEGQPK